MKEPTSKPNIRYKYNIGDLLIYDYDGLIGLNKNYCEVKLICVIDKRVRYSHVVGDYQPSYHIIEFPGNTEQDVFERFLIPYKRQKN